MSSAEHHRSDARAVRCAIITVSDTRTPEDDASGRCIRGFLENGGHPVEQYVIVRDEPAQITDAIAALPASVQLVLINGGTGIAPRDTTYEAVKRLIEKEIPGFGELFRALSYPEVGAAAMLSRAVAGVAGSRLLFSMPGSTAAVQLAMTKLILPQLGHVASLLGEGM